MKKLTDDFKGVYKTSLEIGNFTDNQKLIASLVIKMVEDGEINEHQACFLLGNMVGKNDKDVKELQKTLNEEVKVKNEC